MTKQIEVNILGRDFTISCPENEEENLKKKHYRIKIPWYTKHSQHHTSTKN